MGAERGAVAGELRQARLEGADVLRSVPTGIVTVDQDGHVLYCNPAAEQILGFKERQWRGGPGRAPASRVSPPLPAGGAAPGRRRHPRVRGAAPPARPERAVLLVGATTPPAQ